MNGQQTLLFNDLKRSYECDAHEINNAIQDVLKSGHYILGPQHNKFEADFASYLGVSDVIGVACGTDALALIFAGTQHIGRVGPSARIITTANAGGYASVAARQVGMQVEYVDVDEQTHCMSVVSLESALTWSRDSVAAVVVTHLYGRVAELPAIEAVCARYRVPLVEDCAQAAGAIQDNRRAGSVGLASAFSFYPTKNLGALGDGGAVATSDPKLADAIRSLRQYGWQGKYKKVLPGGMNSRLDELQAAILNVRLPRLEAQNARRREIISSYRTFASAKLRVLSADDASHAGHLAVVVTSDRDGLSAHLARHGIMTDIHYPIPDHRQICVEGSCASPSVDLHVTDTISKQVLSLPCFPQLESDEIRRVCDALASF